MLRRKDIATELKNGRQHALEAVYNLFYPALRIFAGNLLHDIPAAEDILTEVFVSLWKKHTDFDNLSNIKAFLFISTRNACINYVKKRQRDDMLQDAFEQYQSLEQEGFVLNEIIRAEIMQQIYEAIEALPEKCKDVFKLSYIDGLSNAEIANRSSLSVNTVKNHKVRALSMLRFKFFRTGTDIIRGFPLICIFLLTY